MNTKFSVAISVYKNDNAVFFNKALESITGLQTVKPTEIVLAVDGPVGEDLEKVIQQYQKTFKGFKTIRLKTNAGLGVALKAAAENCSYNLIARMDSDDIAVPTRFEEQLAFLQKHPEVEVIGGDIAEFVTEKSIVSERRVPIENAEIYQYLKKRCPMNHVTVMMKKSSLQKAGGYLEWHYNEDYYLWARMALQGVVFANTGTNLVKVRVGKEMYSRRGGIKYFKSEAKLQKYLLQHKLITPPRYFVNVAERLVLQVLMPNRLRGFIFQKFARK